MRFRAASVGGPAVKRRAVRKHGICVLGEGHQTALSSSEHVHQ